MQYLGDFAASDTVEFSFNTRTSAGAPITLAGGALAVYKDAGTTALTLSPAPVLDTDVGAVTGLHHVTLALTDSDLVAGSDYSIVLSAGTVDGTSVAGTVLAQFSIENRVVTAAAPSAATVADAVWDELTAAHSGAGSTGETLADILAGVDPALMTSVIAAVSSLGAGTVTVTSPVTATGVVTLVQGDTYAAADVTWTDTASTWPVDIATADSLTWYADTLEITCTYNAGTNAIELGALTSAQTNELQAGSHSYRIVARWTAGSRVETIGSGTLNVETYRP